MENEEMGYYDYAPAPVTTSDILFSFEGRINRSKYWGYSLLLIGALVVIAIGGATLVGEVGFWIFYGLACIALIWPGLALGVKRCHDRDKSGWFMLVSLIPIVSIWYLVEVGFLRGTDGPNQYGEDPLGYE